jgi:hypothetical protein
VKVICAWCIRDGRRGFLREKAPLEDPRETHGLCDEHFRGIHTNGTATATEKSVFLQLGRLLSALSLWMRDTVCRKNAQRKESR